ncbi:MAG: hypothetical protein PHP00_07485, partial [Thiotrichaceae bacterium]|nr:hypothetical protein [Thiotrichaceae bacterium]
MFKRKISCIFGVLAGFLANTSAQAAAIFNEETGVLSVSSVDIDQGLATYSASLQMSGTVHFPKEGDEFTVQNAIANVPSELINVAYNTANGVGYLPEVSFTASASTYRMLLQYVPNTIPSRLKVVSIAQNSSANYDSSTGELSLPMISINQGVQSYNVLLKRADGKTGLFKETDEFVLLGFTNTPTGLFDSVYDVPTGSAYIAQVIVNDNNRVLNYRVRLQNIPVKNKEIWRGKIVSMALNGNEGTSGSKGDTGSAGTSGNTILNGTGAPATSLGKNGDFYIDTATNKLYGPKASDAWPTLAVSLVGPAGSTGVVSYGGGANGLNGTNGKTILNGTGAPSASIGVDGDFYIDTAATVFYGPKTSGAWSTGVSLIGAAGAPGPAGTAGTAGVAGATGQDGKSLLNGSGAPTAAIGNDGDFYIDTTANTIYGPKTSGAWSAGVSLIGAAGATGPQGATGATGATGSTGATGATGPAGTSILSGTVAPAAGVGNNGDFYINTATNTLYGPKAAGVWPAGVSLVGATGTSVLSGTVAPAAGVGNNGDFYINTATNTLYGPKAAGAWPTGVSLVGATGTSVLSGTIAPVAGTGNNGDFYINTATNTLYGPKAAGAWPAGVSLVGAAGTSVLSGTTAPVAGTGNNGDFYINTATNTLYGPKAAGAWPAGVSLVGAAGTSVLSGT